MAQNTENTKEEFIKCPCCGELTLHKPLDIKSLILDEYMASIITGVPFAHTYTVYDSIDITAEIPTKHDAQFVYGTIQRLNRLAAMCAGKEPLDTADKLKSAAGMIQTYSTITSIVTRRDKQIVKTYAPAEAIKNFCVAIKEIPDTNIELILEAFEECDSPEILSTVPDLMIRAIEKTHNDIYTILLNTGFNENFWKGIELA